MPRVQNLSNVGFYYQMLGDSVKGEEYIRQSYKTEPIVANSNLLAKIYFNRGRHSFRHEYMAECPCRRGCRGEAELRGAMARILYEAGKYKESGDNSTRADFLNDSLRSSNVRPEKQMCYSLIMITGCRWRRPGGIHVWLWRY